MAVTTASGMARMFPMCSRPIMPVPITPYLIGGFIAGLPGEGHRSRIGRIRLPLPPYSPACDHGSRDYTTGRRLSPTRNRMVPPVPAGESTHPCRPFWSRAERSRHTLPASTIDFACSSWSTCETSAWYPSVAVFPRGDLRRRCARTHMSSGQHARVHHDGKHNPADRCTSRPPSIGDRRREET